MTFENLKSPRWIRPLRDPRWIILGFLSMCITVFIFSNPGYGKTIDRLFLAFAAAFATDILIENLILRRPWRFPLSSLTTATGIVLILFAPAWWVFVTAPIIAILSKFLIRVGSIHIFNPNNFAIVFALLFMGNEVSTTLGRWGGPPSMFYVIILVGAIAAFLAGRWLVALSWIIGFLAQAEIRALLEGVPVAQNLVVMGSPLFYVYSFYHITDPITSPRNVQGQIIFGLAIAMIDGILRAFMIRYSPFLALFTVTAFQPLLPWIFVRDQTRAVWTNWHPRRMVTAVRPVRG